MNDDIIIKTETAYHISSGENVGFFATHGGFYSIHVYEEIGHILPHFHVQHEVIVNDNENILNEIKNLVRIERPNIEDMIDKDIHLPFNKSMNSDIAICINSNNFLSHYSDEYYTKHPILINDSDFIYGLNDYLRQKVKNGLSRWDIIRATSFLYGNDERSKISDNMFAKECPTYTEDMLLILN